MILENCLSAPYLIEEWMNFDQTYIKVYCDLEFIIDTIFFNNMSVQTGGGYTFSSENTDLVSSEISELSPHASLYSTISPWNTNALNCISHNVTHIYHIHFLHQRQGSNYYSYPHIVMFSAQGFVLSLFYALILLINLPVGWCCMLVPQW